MLKKMMALMFVGGGFLAVAAGCTDLCSFLGLDDTDCANLLASFASGGGDHNGDQDGDHNGDQDGDQDGDGNHDGDHNGDNDFSDGDADAGAAVFAANCAVCHADDGTGDIGPNIRGEDEEDVWDHISGHEGHTTFSALTEQDAADIAAFLAQ
jgi:hypothetical protein